MEKLGKIMVVIDQSLCTRERRHIFGGIMLSMSLLFGGLAVTALTLREEEPDEFDMVYSEKDKTYILQAK